LIEYAAALCRSLDFSTETSSFHVLTNTAAPCRKLCPLRDEESEVAILWQNILVRKEGESCKRDGGKEEREEGKKIHVQFQMASLTTEVLQEKSLDVELVRNRICFDELSVKMPAI
jgi:hypothetical protein